MGRIALDNTPQETVPTPIERKPLLLGRKVPAEGPCPARWMIVGEAPGGDEESHVVGGVPTPRPFVGWSGRLLDGCLAAAGLPRQDAFVTNVVKYRPPANKIAEWFTEVQKKAHENGLIHHTDGMYYNDVVKEGVDELLSDIEKVKPEVIVACGNTPLWALTGQMGISKWRGSELWYGDARLIPVTHPAFVLRDMGQRPYLIHDLRERVMAKMSCPWAGKEPIWDFRTGRDYDRLKMLLTERLWVLDETSALPYLSVDVETKKGRIDCFCLAWSRLDAICIPLIDTHNNGVWSTEQWEILGGLSRRILTHPRARIIGQNFNYDAQYFAKDPSFSYLVHCAHDSKIAQHTLLPGTDKDLVMLSSLCCDWHCFWKDDLKESAQTLNDEQRWRYNCRDGVVTWEVAMKQIPMLKKEGFL